jgi:hypothetical protein
VRKVAPELTQLELRMLKSSVLETDSRWHLAFLHVEQKWMRLINLEPQSSHGCNEYHNVQKQEIRRCFMNIDASQIKLYSTDWSPRKTSDRKHLETTIFFRNG